MRPIKRLFGIPFCAAGFFGIYALLQFAAADAPDARDLPAKVDAIFQKWNRADAPGCALGVEHDAGPRFFRAYGSADLEHGAAIDPNTVFEAGSVSKQFTAALVLMLVEHGKLGLGDDVHKYIQELPDYGTKITIAQLLDHTSGLRDWEGVAEIAGWPRTTRLYTQRDVLEITTRQKSLNFWPGTEYSYSNTGYVLLAIIVERVSGESLATFSSDQLFEPLGLIHTRWRDDFRTVVKGRAVAYDADSNGYHQFMPFANVIGSGGLLTTAGDLLTWNDALDAGKLGRFVTTELQRESMLADGRTIGYARGLKISSSHGFRQIWHNGETAGYEAFLARYPDQHVSIALLCNAGEGADATSLGGKVVDLLLPARGAQPPASPAGATPPAGQLGRYAGTYFSVRTALQMRLEAKDGGLQRVSDGHTFSAIAPGIFKDLDSTVTFTGHDRFVRDFVDGRRGEFQRVQTWHPGPEELSSLAGRYRSEEALATYDVSAVDGHLVFAQDDRRWDAVTLDVLSIDTFSTPHAAYRFVRNANGKIVSLEVSNSGVYDLSFRRVSY
jgi:CubicO group peptidase (beta-lactamase class C family)